MSDIVVPGFPTTDVRPGTRIAIAFGAGPADGSDGPKSVLLFGMKLAAGTGTVDTVVYGPDTPVRLANEADVILLAGRNSEAHYMWKAFRDIDSESPLYMVFVTENAGGTAAKIDLAVTGTVTGTGSIVVYVGDKRTELVCSIGDTAAVVATALANAVNAIDSLCIGSNSVAGTLTLTARHKGIGGNEIRVQLAQGATPVSGLTFSMADAPLAGGLLEESYTAALATTSSLKNYWLVPARNSATVLGAFATLIAANQIATVGLRQRLVAACTSSVATASALAIGLNNERCEIWNFPKSVVPGSIIAAHNAAIIARHTSGATPRTNFTGWNKNSEGGGYFKLPVPRATDARTTSAEQTSAITNGVSLVDFAGSDASLYTRVTTRSLTSGVGDSRIRAAHKVDIVDKIADDVETKLALEHQGKMIAADPIGTAPIPPRAITPGMLRGVFSSVLNKWADYIDDVKKAKASIVTQRATTPTNRLLGKCDVDVVDNADQFGILISQVG